MGEPGTRLYFEAAGVGRKEGEKVGAQGEGAFSGGRLLEGGVGLAQTEGFILRSYLPFGHWGALQAEKDPLGDREK